MKDTQLASAYQEIMDEYLEKGCIRVVPPSEPQPDSEWFLTHIPVARHDKARKWELFLTGLRSMMRRVNTEALPGQKLQSNRYSASSNYAEKSLKS